MYSIDQLKRDALVMANARRLIKAKRITSNGRLYMELFGTGLGTARDRCRELGLDPDGHATNYNSMIEHLDFASNPRQKNQLTRPFSEVI